MSDLAQPSRAFRPEERPMFPGSPYAPTHALIRRFGYATVGLLLGATLNLANGIVSANVPVLAGARQDYLISTALLPGIYVAFNASANLVLVKGRAQFGIPKVTLSLLFATMSAALILFLAPGPLTAIGLSAVSGMTAAGLTTLTVYYFMQSFPAPIKPLGLIIGIGTTQLGTPLARLVPVDLLALDGGQSFALLELGIALLGFALIYGYPLPPSERSKAFEPLDIVVFALFLGANILLCSALAEGRLLWWSDTPWIGLALAGCIPLYATAILIERERANPMLRLSWISTGTMLRFAAVAIVVRLALAEQSYGSVGLLGIAGLDNDQYHTLFGWILLAEILGIVVAVVTLRADRPPYQVMAAAIVIAFGAWLDTGSSNVTRPDNLFLSQSLIAFGTTLFIGPALVFGAAQMLRRGPDHLVSFVVLFSMTQNIGGLAGSALLGSYQIIRAKVHAAILAEGMLAGNPLVADRIQQGGHALAGAITDPAQQTIQGAGLLGGALGREAAILGFNDAFWLIVIVALCAAAFIASAIIWIKWRDRQIVPKGA